MELHPPAASKYEEPRIFSPREVGDLSEGVGLYAGSMALALLGLDLNKHKNVVSTVPGSPDTGVEEAAEAEPSEYADLREYLQQLAVRQEVQLQPPEFRMRTWH